MKDSDPRSFGWLGIIFWVAIGGTLVWTYGAATTKKEATFTRASSGLTVRKQATQDIIKAGPTSTAWETQHGTVIALDIPRATAGGLLVEQKRCIVWRDAVTKTSSLQCDKEEIDIRRHSIDPPDIE
jgi:hypothetical protein